MRVNIGPYTNWVGPYQIADKVFFWVEKYPEEELENRWDYKLHERFGNFLGSLEWLTNLCLWIESKKKRKIKVKIDHYDLWGMDHTMALIIHPMLQKLQEVKHGAPWVDDADVPEELKSTSAPPKKNEWGTDDNHFKRWDWVLDEMIFAFQSQLEEDWDEQYWSGDIGKMVTKETDETHINPVTKREEKLYTIQFTGNRTCDWEARQKHQDRISNGFRLFGKYYEHLWS